MEHRPVALGAGLAGLGVLAVFAFAIPSALAGDAGAAAKHERAERLEREAKALRVEAAGAFKADEAECRTRFLVNDCIKAAKERRLGRIEQARRMELEQAALEREARHAELAARREEKLHQRATEGPPPAVVSVPGRPVPEGRPLQ